MKIQKLFTSGKMNKDLDERLVPQGEYRDALNVKVGNSNSSDVGAIENALSNEQLSTIELGSNAQCIGAIADDRNKKIYWWVKSDTGSYILEYNKTRDKTSYVIADTRPTDTNVLKFSKSNLIHSANIVYDSDNDNVFIYWTDGKNPPRSIEVNDAKKLVANDFDEQYVNVIKALPSTEATIAMVDDTYIRQKFTEDSFFGI